MGDSRQLETDDSGQRSLSIDAEATRVQRRWVSRQLLAWTAASRPIFQRKRLGAFLNTGLAIVLLAGIAVSGRLTSQQPGNTAARSPDLRLIDHETGLGETRLGNVSALAQETLEALRERFPGTPTAPIDIHLHPDASTLDEGLRRNLHEGTPGFARLGLNTIHILLDQVQPREPGDLRTVLQHELVHVLLDQYAGDRGPLIPRWLHEGMAQVYSDYSYLGGTEETLAVAASYGRMPLLIDLTEDFPSDPLQRKRAYAVARSFTSFLIREGEERTLLRAVRALRDDDSGFGGAWVRVSKRSLSDLYARWRDYIQYGSGAGWRFLFNNCFSYLMIGCFVLLALAVIRRFERDRRHRIRLERAEAAEAEAALQAAAAALPEITEDPDALPGTESES